MVNFRIMESGRLIDNQATPLYFYILKMRLLLDEPININIATKQPQPVNGG